MQSITFMVTLLKLANILLAIGGVLVILPFLIRAKTHRGMVWCHNTIGFGICFSIVGLLCYAVVGFNL